MTPKEKRILTTNDIGEVHEKMSKSDAWKRAFSGTGTLLPVEYFVRDENG